MTAKDKYLRTNRSQRLKAVAALVPAGSVLADIGTDHAYVPVDLVREGIIPSAIAMDVKEGPLKRAAENVHLAGLADRIQLRLSDGLKELRPGEASCAVLAGMGGGLVIRILRDAMDIANSLQSLVLQPQSEIEKVRLFLDRSGFGIEAEDMVCEDGKYYPMMRVRPNRGAGKEETPSEQDLFFCYGPCLLKSRHPVLQAYLLREREVNESILLKLSGTDTEKGAERKRQIIKTLDRNARALRLYQA